jgi:hypothetical protein
MYCVCVYKHRPTFCLLTQRAISCFCFLYLPRQVFILPMEGEHHTWQKLKSTRSLDHRCVLARIVVRVVPTIIWGMKW